MARLHQRLQTSLKVVYAMYREACHGGHDLDEARVWKAVDAL